MKIVLPLFDPMLREIACQREVFRINKNENLRREIEFSLASIFQKYDKKRNRLLQRNSIH